MRNWKLEVRYYLSIKKRGNPLIKEFVEMNNASDRESMFYKRPTLLLLILLQTYQVNV